LGFIPNVFFILVMLMVHKVVIYNASNTCIISGTTFICSMPSVLMFARSSHVEIKTFQFVMLVHVRRGNAVYYWKIVIDC
jgi:hypothetical protein